MYAAAPHSVTLKTYRCTSECRAACIRRVLQCQSTNSKKQVQFFPITLIRASILVPFLPHCCCRGAAQAQQAPAADTAPLQEIVVTGSMIKRVNAETAEAITILKADALKDQGITNVEQAMNTLTSANPSINIASAVGTFSGGGTYANLRGLGNGRTLVLLDGQRLAPNAFRRQWRST